MSRQIPALHTLPTNCSSRSRFSSSIGLCLGNALSAARQPQDQLWEWFGTLKPGFASEPRISAENPTVYGVLPPTLKLLSIAPMLPWTTTGLRGMWSRAGRAGALQLCNRSPSPPGTFRGGSGICSCPGHDAALGGGCSASPCLSFPIFARRNPLERLEYIP